MTTEALRLTLGDLETGLFLALGLCVLISVLFVGMGAMRERNQRKLREAERLREYAARKRLAREETWPKGEPWK